jgi:16S rRNA G966 N2-methylase RsmD
LKADSVEVVCDDALSVMRRGPPGAYDLVLLDPPYGSGLVESALASATALVETGGYAYAEDSRMLSAPAGWSIIRQGRAGAVFFHLLRRD